MRLRVRPRPDTLHDRLVWQCASLLLCYPDQARLDTADQLLGHLDGEAAILLRRTAAALKAGDPMRVAADYVETFDLCRLATMYLTYWTAGDTRNRGAAMLEFVAAYRAAGVEPPRGEAPDYLPVVLEFAATVDPVAGRRLLTAHRVSIDVLHGALIDTDSPYALTVAAVHQTLPAATDDEVHRARRMTQTGAPAEAVGLQPFMLTVPPRRTDGGG